MSSGDDGDRHREHLGVIQTNKTKKKKSRRPIDPEDIPGSLSSAPERISHDTHLFVVPFDSSSEQSDVMAGTPPLTRWPPARDLKDCVRRLYTQAYHSWSEIPNSIRQAMFNEFKTLCTWESRDKFKAMSEQAKKARGSLKGGSLHTGGAKTVGTITREMKKELGHTPIEPEVFKKTHVKKEANESDLDVWVEERAKRTFYVTENLDSSIQMTPELSTQIWIEKVIGRTHKGGFYGLGSRNDEIKEQVLNLARRHTTSSPAEDTDDDNDEDDDFVDRTP
ncbi:hypothetical protein MTR67_043805 [Solanum verrucosum]|uniref:Uncharacterized protein n=1 Tax=Solanum verrucosum TaxID=315347 RepID=A0AAF0ZV24_SOLVR|nr:hypothetical protein MTR67_043805 [Solanum verrucosum]